MRSELRVKKVVIYSLLLIVGLVGSQFLSPDSTGIRTGIQLATMAALAFIMIHVGYEFEMDKSRPRQYAWDGFVAFVAASLPWLLCALYFVFVMAPSADWGKLWTWEQAFLQGLFAAPTSAGVLFSMLAAAGLSATWVFKKARVLAIFDDLSTILLIVPLKIMLAASLKWQLIVVIAMMAVLLWMAWRYLHVVRLPVTWPWVISYALLLTALCEGIYVGSKAIDADVPIHVEVLLPAFVLGCMLRRPDGVDCHVHDAVPGHEEGPSEPAEQSVSTLISAAFMVLVGFSMPSIFTGNAPETGPSWGMITVHVAVITVLSNLGKMFAAMCYRNQATVRERLAVAIGMFPRGEVGAGVLVVGLTYGMAGPSLTVAVLSLALNLLCTGLFIVAVKKLLSKPAAESSDVVIPGVA